MFSSWSCRWDTLWTLGFDLMQRPSCGALFQVDGSWWATSTTDVYHSQKLGQLGCWTSSIFLKIDSDKHWKWNIDGITASTKFFLRPFHHSGWHWSVLCKCELTANKEGALFFGGRAEANHSWLTNITVTMPIVFRSVLWICMVAKEQMDQSHLGSLPNLKNIAWTMGHLKAAKRPPEPAWRPGNSHGHLRLATKNVDGNEPCFKPTSNGMHKQLLQLASFKPIEVPAFNQ